MFDMRRREFITLLPGGIAAAWPLAAVGQPIKKMPKVGVLWHAANAEEEALGLGALTRGFRDLGYTDGKNIALHHRFPAELTERFASLSAELAAVPVDVLVSGRRAQYPLSSSSCQNLSNQNWSTAWPGRAGISPV
jgi:putative ABC transport system substrate-binding protein